MRARPTKDFRRLLDEVKLRIERAQTRAILSANAVLVRLYWDVGRLLDERQERAGWGAAALERLSAALKRDLPGLRGFSRRNLFLMMQFYREHPRAFVQPVVAQIEGKSAVGESSASAPAFVQPLVAQIPWAHNVLLMQRVKEDGARLWYMQQTVAHGWSRNVLLAMIRSSAHRRQGRSLSNFERALPAPQSDLIRQTLKDPYIFDFLALQEPLQERELETGLLSQLERFLLELGQGFAFVGRQYPLQVGKKDFHVDLLFYQLQLRCYVVIDLKTGEFKPEHAGKMNFYLSVVDDHLRHATDAPTIGLILCQDRNRVVAEYALRDVVKPIGVSEYELTRALPTGLRSSLPSVEEIEAQFTDSAGPEAERPPVRNRTCGKRKAALRRRPSRRKPTGKTRSERQR